MWTMNPVMCTSFLILNTLFTLSLILCTRAYSAGCSSSPSSRQTITVFLSGNTFHSIDAVFTVDIDLANKQQKQVKEIVEPFVSDMAADVATLPRNYRDRLVPYSGGEFESFDVYLLSIEDLVITTCFCCLLARSISTVNTASML